MEGITTLEEHRAFDGVQGFYEHESQAIGLRMRFGVYLPPQARQAPCPVVLCLAGLTCNEQTFAIKAGAQQHAARHGLVLATPDTSPRDTGIDGATGDWEVGEGAGFYLDATQAPWSSRFCMETFVVHELPQCVREVARVERESIAGHSMGGHGALVLALRNPGRYRAVSAFAPIASPTRVPWGRKAFAHYLGEDRAAWRAHDAVELLAGGATLPGTPRMDIGLDDKFLDVQLKPELLEARGVAVHRHPGYDHSYWFIQTLAEAHLRHHADALA